MVLVWRKCNCNLWGDYDGRRKALKATGNSGIQSALDWLAKNQDEPEGAASEGGAAEGGDPEDNEPKSLKCNDCNKMFSSVAIAQFHAAKTGHQDFSESTEARPELTAEEKTARLAELRERLEEKRKLDKLKGDEERREAELLRRKSGHNAAMARREMQEKEMVKAAEQLRKDREEEKQIRARIRAEMEEEKRLRKAAINAEATKPKEPETPEEPLKLVSQDSDSIRIQVKLAGGDNIKAVFKSSDKLAVLLDKLSEKTALTPTNKLMVPFPRTYIDVEADAEKTFMELGLCPSASLVLE